MYSSRETMCVYNSIVAKSGDLNIGSRKGEQAMQQSYKTLDCETKYYSLNNSNFLFPD